MKKENVLKGGPAGEITPLPPSAARGPGHGDRGSLIASLAPREPGMCTDSSLGETLSAPFLQLPLSYLPSFDQ